MPAPPGSYNAREYHEQSARTVEEDLRRALAAIRPGTVFRNVSALAAHVAAACHQTAGNLRRNRRYRAILEDHVARQPGAVALLGDDTRSVAVLRAKLLESNLRAANLDRDRRRLEAFVEKHLSDQGKPDPEQRRDRPPGPERPEGGADPRRDFECTVAALEAVLRHAETYELDPGSGALMDLGARPGSPPVVGAHLLTAFVKWLDRKDGPPRTGPP